MKWQREFCGSFCGFNREFWNDKVEIELKVNFWKERFGKDEDEEEEKEEEWDGNVNEKWEVGIMKFDSGFIDSFMFINEEKNSKRR